MSLCVSCGAGTMDRTYLHGICLSFSPMLCLKVHTAFDYLDFLRLCILAQVKSTACICMHKVSQEIVILIHQSPVENSSKSTICIRKYCIDLRGE